MQSHGRPAESSEPRPQCSTAREPYVRPRLTLLGNVREVTLGGTPGVGDSINPGTRHA
jgi:hypothetical protein